MTRLERPSPGAWITSAGQLALLVVAAQIGTPSAWRYALAAVAAVSFAASVAAFRRYRRVEDVPTSRIASAAQGYVEIFGRAAMLDGEPVLSRITALPCCWYRYLVERRDGDNRWVHEDSGTSKAHFLVRDGTGECVISPEGAEVVGVRGETRIEGDHRHTEWLILPGSPLYAIGELRTAGGALAELDERRDVNALLTDWKHDRPALLARYDANGDGDIDLREWETARLDAVRAVHEQHRQTRLQDGVHVLAKPRDGRPFLLATERPDRLGRRYARWCVFHLSAFATSVGIALAL